MPPPEERAYHILEGCSALSGSLVIPPCGGNFLCDPTTRLLLSFDDRRHHKLAWPIVGRVGLLHLVVAKKRKKKLGQVRGLKALTGEVRSENRPLGHRRSCA